MLKWLAPPITMRKALVVFAALWVGIYAVLAFANLSPPPNAARCSWAFPKILSCLLGVRENLTGGLIGGGGALFAAWVAWSAVREQMNETREIALRTESQALELVKSEIESLLDIFQAVWSILDDTFRFTGDPDELVSRMTAVRSAFTFYLPKSDELDGLETGAVLLGPIHRRDASLVISRMRMVLREIDALWEGDEGPDQLKIRQARCFDVILRLEMLHAEVARFSQLDASRLSLNEPLPFSPRAKRLTRSYESSLEGELAKRRASG